MYLVIQVIGQIAIYVFFAMATREANYKMWSAQIRPIYVFCALLMLVFAAYDYFMHRNK